MSPPGSNSFNLNGTATGYITEKMYVLLQLYLQNKNWNSNLELLNCLSELKETSVLSTSSYLQYEYFCHLYYKITIIFIIFFGYSNINFFILKFCVFDFIKLST